MKYAYYPGCSAHSTARDMNSSSLAVARRLGIELVEPERWTCCGASAAHQTDRVLAAALPAANLVLAKQKGLDMVVNCAACYNRMKTANHAVRTSPQMREKVRAAIGQDYDGSVPVRHFVEILLQDAGLDKLRKAFTASLGGLRVACYYGCFLVRPREIMQFDDPENPTSLDDLVTAMGGESLDWPHKVECCGGGLNLTRPDLLVRFAAPIVEMAEACGAGCIAVACPMCHASLDLRRGDIDRATGSRHTVPVLYITQLLGLALGVPQRELGLGNLMVAPVPVLRAVKSLR
jgi:heterodisulfide reductase subunit B